MKKFAVTFFICLLALLTGCASTPPQAPLTISKDFYSNKTTKIAVIMNPLPTVDTQFPGADCLLCLGVASLSNRSLTAHTQTLTHEDLPMLKSSVAKLFKDKGYQVTAIDGRVDFSALPKFGKSGPNVAQQDYSTLKAKYGVDKLVVIAIHQVGIYRPYSGYVSVGDPKAVVSGLGYMVDLSSNVYEWYFPISIQKSADTNWDEPPKFPGLTNAYYQAIEATKDSVLESLSK
jgi:hypothetical protein